MRLLCILCELSRSKLLRYFLIIVQHDTAIAVRRELKPLGHNKNKTVQKDGSIFGGPSEARTHDTLLKRQVL